MAKNLGKPSASRQQLYEPDELVSVRGGYPTVEPMPAFRYAHAATRWRVIKGKVVPDLSRIPLSPGSQHVLNREGGKIDVALHKASLEARELNLIDYKAGPNGKTYVSVFDTKHKNRIAKSYCSVFETPIVGSPTLRVNTAALADWLEGLVTSGLIAPPDAQILEARATETRERLASAQSKVATGQGALSLLVDELKVELAAWEKALSDLPEMPSATLYADIDEDDEAEPEAPKTPRKRASVSA